VATPALAYTGEETTATAEAKTETEAASSTDAAEKETTAESKKDVTKSDDTSEVENAQPYDVTVNDDGTMTITYNGEELVLGGDDSDGSIGTGKVSNVSDGSYLNLRDGAGMSANIIGHLLPGTEVTVLGEEGDWYKVSLSEQTGYVSKDYLDVALNSSDDSEMSAEMLTLLMLMMMQGTGTSDTDSTGLTPDGNLTLVDDIGSSTGAGQQFITLTTKAGNVFYLIIDRDDDGNENVHFMNLVDEADLFALLDEDAQAAYESQQAAQTTEPEATETPSDTESTEGTEVPEDTEAEKKTTNWAPLMLLIIVMIGGVGGFLYVTVTKKKKQAEAAKPDPDADYEDEDDAGYELPEDEGEDESSEDEQIYTDAPDFGEDEPDEDNEPV